MHIRLVVNGVQAGELATGCISGPLDVAAGCVASQKASCERTGVNLVSAQYSPTEQRTNLYALKTIPCFRSKGNNDSSLSRLSRLYSPWYTLGLTKPFSSQTARNSAAKSAEKLERPNYETFSMYIVRQSIPHLPSQNDPPDTAC